MVDMPPNEDFNFFMVKIFLSERKKNSLMCKTYVNAYGLL